MLFCNFWNSEPHTLCYAPLSVARLERSLFSVSWLILQSSVGAVKR